MPSHFSSIGLTTENVEDLEGLVQRVLPDSVAVVAANGSYRVWKSDSGAQLWLQVNRRNQLVGAHPHFSGSASVAVRAVETVHYPDDSELDGAFQVWVNSGSEAAYDEYPFVFACANYGERQGVSLPAIGKLQISAFAHEISAFSDEEEFLASQSDGLKFATECFVPSGMFGDGSTRPEPIALFAGLVIEAARKLNELSGSEFLWCRVKTLGTEIDVVADPTLLPEVPRPGQIVFGTFWLSGVWTELRSEYGYFQRIWRRIRRAG